jgi:hypothetical protein
MALAPEEQAEGYALACQAWPASDLVARVEVLPALLREPTRHMAQSCRYPFAPASSVE